VQLGLENKKKTFWAAGLAVVALLAIAYQFFPLLSDNSTPALSAQAAAPVVNPRGSSKSNAKPVKKVKPENLDPTLRLDLLAATEKTQYEGNGRNIFVSQAEDIPNPKASPNTDTKKKEESTAYVPPQPPQQAPIPLKFYGFASSPGEPKKIFLKLNDDVFVAGEGEIVDRRYKVIHISNTSVEIQDVVGSGPPQNIPLTQG
jgi:hypothetical protein